MKVIDLFNTILKANCYCTYDKYKDCDCCPYEGVDNCQEEIKKDIETVRERLITID